MIRLTRRGGGCGYRCCPGPFGRGPDEQSGNGAAEVRFRMRKRLTLAGGNGALPCHHRRGQEVGGLPLGHRLRGVGKPHASRAVD